jgi:hypothetical protein
MTKEKFNGYIHTALTFGDVAGGFLSSTSFSKAFSLSSSTLVLCCNGFLIFEYLTNLYIFQERVVYIVIGMAMFFNLSLGNGIAYYTSPNKA